MGTDRRLGRGTILEPDKARAAQTWQFGVVVNGLTVIRDANVLIRRQI